MKVGAVPMPLSTPYRINSVAGAAARSPSEDALRRGIGPSDVLYEGRREAGRAARSGNDQESGFQRPHFGFLTTQTRVFSDHTIGFSTTTISGFQRPDHRNCHENQALFQSYPQA